MCKSRCSVAKIHHQYRQFKSNVLSPMLMFQSKRETDFYSIPGARLYSFQSFLCLNLGGAMASTVIGLQHQILNLVALLYEILLLRMYLPFIRKEQNGKLVQLKSLGDNVLFLGNLALFSVSASYFSNFRHRDSIYFNLYFSA